MYRSEFGLKNETLNSLGIVVVKRNKKYQITVNHKVKLKESEKLDKYLSFVKVLKISNTKVTVVPFVN